MSSKDEIITDADRTLALWRLIASIGKRLFGESPIVRLENRQGDFINIIGDGGAVAWTKDDSTSPDISPCVLLSRPQVQCLIEMPARETVLTLTRVPVVGELLWIGETKYRVETVMHSDRQLASGKYSQVDAALTVYDSGQAMAEWQKAADETCEFVLKNPSILGERK